MCARYFSLVFRTNCQKLHNRFHWSVLRGYAYPIRRFSVLVVFKSMEFTVFSVFYCFHNHVSWNHVLIPTKTLLDLWDLKELTRNHCFDKKSLFLTQNHCFWHENDDFDTFWHSMPISSQGPWRQPAGLDQYQDQAMTRPGPGNDQFWHGKWPVKPGRVGLRLESGTGTTTQYPVPGTPHPTHQVPVPTTADVLSAAVSPRAGVLRLFTRLLFENRYTGMFWQTRPTNRPTRPTNQTDQWDQANETRPVRTRPVDTRPWGQGHVLTTVSDTVLTRLGLWEHTFGQNSVKSCLKRCQNIPRHSRVYIYRKQTLFLTRSCNVSTCFWIRHCYMNKCTVLTKLDTVLTI